MAANEELRRQLAESHRSGRRQAFKRPGRKPGMGLFSYRKPPSAEAVTGNVAIDESVASETATPMPRMCDHALWITAESIARRPTYPLFGRPQVRASECRLPVQDRAKAKATGIMPTVSIPIYGPISIRAKRAELLVTDVTTAIGKGPCTPLWGGCSGTEDSRCSQSADRG